MATNDFKPFATGAGANVTSQEDWEALVALVTGFQSGKASSAQVNKAIRQATTMASVVAQFIADTTGNDVLDNGDTQGLVANFKTALDSATTGRLLNVQLFTLSGTYTPTTGTKFIIVEGVGGGAGGGGSSSPTANLYSAAGGGVSGTYGKAKFPVPAAPVSVTIGAPGDGGAAGTSASGSAKEGAPGGDTMLGALLRCPGGKMSKASNSFPANSVCSSEFSSSADAPVIDASGILLEKVHGAVSTPGIIMGTFLISGRGADSPLGRGGIPRYRSGNDLASGADGLGYGAGGGGACSGSGQQGMPGGSGTQGCLIVWEYA